MRHCSQHGWDAETYLIGYFSSKEDCALTAQAFSEENNIVDAVDKNGKKIWANCIHENGLDGGRTISRHWTKAQRKAQSLRLKGRVVSPETIEKIRQASVGQVRTAEQRENQRLAQLKPATRRKKSLSARGKKQSLETIAKRVQKLVGQVRSEATKEKMRGRRCTKATKKRMSVAQKGKIVSEETKAKLRKARASQTFSTATKRKLSGKIVVISKVGTTVKMDCEKFHLQKRQKPESSYYVTVASTEGKRRRAKFGYKSNSVPVFSDEEAKDISTMRRN